MRVFLFYMLCLQYNQSEFIDRLYGFNLWTSPCFLSFFLSLMVVIVNFSIVPFMSTLSFLRPIKSWVFLCYSVTENSRSKGSTRLGASLPEEGRTAGLRNFVFFFFNFWRWTESKERRWCQWVIHHRLKALRCCKWFLYFNLLKPTGYVMHQ